MGLTITAAAPVVLHPVPGIRGGWAIAIAIAGYLAAAAELSVESRCSTSLNICKYELVSIFTLSDHP